MAVFIAVIVLVCYFFIPRKPTFCVAVGYPDEFSASTSGFNVSIPVNVSVDNPNYYGFSASDTVVNLVYKIRDNATDSSSTSDSPLSTVNASDIHIKARGNSTNSFQVTAESNAGTAQADGQILADCSIREYTTLYINLAFTVLKRIHITVPDQAIKVNCQFNAISAVGAIPGGTSTGTAGLVNGTDSQGQVYCKKADW